MANIKQFVDYLLENSETIDRSKAMEMLRTEPSLSNEEKNIIFLYCYPRPLLDKELPFRVQTLRGVNKVGHLEPNLAEAALIVEAYRTEQYGRFIRHLMHSFLDPEKIFPVLGEEMSECCICGKPLYQQDVWNQRVPKDNQERSKKEYLCFGSQDSKVNLCLDCLVQLQTAYDIINEIDPDFLTKYAKRTWTELKL